MRESVLLVQAPNPTSLKASELSSSYELVFLNSAEEALKFCSDGKANVASVVLGPLIKDPIQTTQRLYSIDRGISVIILADAGHLPAVKKSILFTPFLTSETACLPVNEPGALVTQITTYVERVVKHRQSRKLNTSLNLELRNISAGRGSLAGGKRDFLERLFDTAPVGIATLNTAGEILALNRRSSEFFGVSERDSLGSSIGRFFPGLILVPDRMEETSFEGPSGRKNFETTITTIIGNDGSKGYLLLFVDITERKKNERDLEKAIRVRDEFISIASHELNTPITSLKLQLQVSERHLQGQPGEVQLEKLRRSNAVALKQVDRLAVLVSDLLDISRIEAGKLHLDFEETNLSLLLRDVAERVAFVAESAECPFEISVPDEIFFRCDPFRLEQIVSNLLTNAFKYASGSKVSLEAIETDGFLRISVRDGGMGISSEKLPFVFDRFERAISHQNISGLGLGLYIARNLTEAHGGHISVESAPGKETLFTVHLPRKNQNPL